MKAETADLESVSESAEIEVSPDALEAISIQKLNEYIELIKLKQEHPEFESDINAQLLSFTTDSLSILYYPKGFDISDIKQLGDAKTESDSTEEFVLGYTVKTETMTFKDSVLVKITSSPNYLQSVEAVSIKKVKFLKFD